MIISLQKAAHMAAFDSCSMKCQFPVNIWFGKLSLTPIAYEVNN